MDIQHLQYFVSVATHGSFTKAARECYVSQPTISKMIKSFEEELGVPLFNRAGKKSSSPMPDRPFFSRRKKR